MKLLNIIIRTYNLDNLVISLDDLPYKITSNYVNLIVHNDNPSQEDRFWSIINDFKLNHPDYNIVPIQETENKQMFLSYINSIKKLPPTKYTMILDDDDKLCTIDGEFIEFLESNYGMIKYRVSKYINSEDGFTPVKTYGYWTAWRKYHRIIPTYELIKILKYEEWLINKLIYYTGSSKFSQCEDVLMCKLMSKISNCEVIKYDKSIVMYNVTPHTVNNYVSYTTTGDNFLVEKNNSIVDQIVSDYESEFSN